MFAKKNLFDKLSEVIHLSRNTESLDDLPDRLERIVQAYSSQAIHPQFRTDIFEILNASAHVAEALGNHTYNAQDAVRKCTSMLSILARLIAHLECERPAVLGFGIMMQPGKELYPGTWSTEDEAAKVIGYLQKDRSAIHYEVVPIRIISDFTSQPMLPQPTHDPELDPIQAEAEPEESFPQVVAERQGSPITPPVPASDFVRQFNHQLKLGESVPAK